MGVGKMTKEEIHEGGRQSLKDRILMEISPAGHWGQWAKLRKPKNKAGKWEAIGGVQSVQQQVGGICHSGLWSFGDWREAGVITGTWVSPTPGHPDNSPDGFSCPHRGSLSTGWKRTCYWHDGFFMTLNTNTDTVETTPFTWVFFLKDMSVYLEGGLSK